MVHIAKLVMKIKITSIITGVVFFVSSRDVLIVLIIKPAIHVMIQEITFRRVKFVVYVKSKVAWTVLIFHHANYVTSVETIF